jgi:hypothetical protein
MKRPFVLLALCASIAVPLAAFAQPAPPAPGSPSPDQRAAMEKLRADAKTAAYGALTPAHATAVTAIVGQVTSRSLDRREAGKQIDALLTPDEQKAVLAAADTSRKAMMAAMGGPPPRERGRFGPPSAGRFLLMVSMARGQRRFTQPRARSTSAP